LHAAGRAKFHNISNRHGRQITKAGKEEHCSLFIVHLAFGIARKSPNDHQALGAI